MKSLKEACFPRRVVITAASIVILAFTTTIATGEEMETSDNNAKAPMDRHIVGVGGVFIRTGDKQAVIEWYGRHLDMSTGEYGGHDFLWRMPDDPETQGRTVMGFFDADTRYFEGPVMVNYIVRDLDLLLEELDAAGIEQLKPRESYDYGDFAWVKDPDGRWIELWEPVYAPKD
jgi:predicted enzyme related to lactoylglutathione lyase